MQILIYSFRPVGQQVLEALVPPLGEAFGLPVRLHPQALKVPAAAEYSEREQWLARGLVQRLAAAPGLPGEPVSAVDVRLGVTDHDLFTTGLNFVFGEASPKQRCAVFSVARLNDGFYGLQPSPAAQFFNRCATEAVHELGHVFELTHCQDRSCVMWFSNTLAETDEKGWRLCDACQQRLAASMRRA